MSKFEDLTLDELKAAAGEHADFLDEKAQAMLSMVKQYETEQDYRFVKYYQAPAFAIFTMGAMAANMNANAWIKPDQEISDSLKESVKGMLGTMMNKELYAIFKEREDLAVRLFGYGTHQVQTEMEEHRLQEEREKEKKADWTYAVVYLKRQRDGNYSGGASFTRYEKEAERLYEQKDKERGTILILMHVSPALSPLIEKLDDPGEFLVVASKHPEDCALLRFNKECIDFVERSTN